MQHNKRESTTNTVDDHISEDDISNSESDNNENEENVSSTMSIEPQSDVAPDYSTPHDITKCFEDKPVQPSNATFPKDKKNSTSFSLS